MMVMEELELRSDERGTPVTFSELYTAEFLPLVRLATLLTGRPDAARDIVQDAFVQLHVKWMTVRNPPAYVRRSVVNGCNSHHRREHRRRDGEQVDGSIELDVDHTLATLAALKPKPRAMVVLKFYEGRTEHEIAEIVGCRPGSVGPTIQRSLASLRTLQS
jgi:DNA-directed RNA polymerase specialized sigma24 family protein